MTFLARAVTIVRALLLDLLVLVLSIFLRLTLAAWEGDLSFIDWDGRPGKDGGYVDSKTHVDTILKQVVK